MKSGKRSEWQTVVFARAGDGASLFGGRTRGGRNFPDIEPGQKYNAKSTTLISLDGGRVKARVIHSNEGIVIARAVARLPNLSPNRKT